MVGFSRRTDEQPLLDGQPTTRINSDLTAGLDLTRNAALPGNLGLCFMGTKKVGAFDIDTETAERFLQGANPHGRPNSDVLRPYRNGSDLVRVCSHRWIIDFGVQMPMEQAALYAAQFRYVETFVKPVREKNARKSRAEK